MPNMFYAPIPPEDDKLSHKSAEMGKGQYDEDLREMTQDLGPRKL